MLAKLPRLYDIESSFPYAVVSLAPLSKLSEGVNLDWVENLFYFYFFENTGVANYFGICHKTVHGSIKENGKYLQGCRWKESSLSADLCLQSSNKVAIPIYVQALHLL